jgi:hypothetical protein
MNTEQVDRIRKRIEEARERDNKLLLGKIKRMLRDLVENGFSTESEIEELFQINLNNSSTMVDRIKADVAISELVGNLRAGLELGIEGIVAGELLRGKSVNVIFDITESGLLTIREINVKSPYRNREASVSPFDVFGSIFYKEDTWVDALAHAFFSGNMEVARSASKGMSAKAVFGWLLKHQGAERLDWEEVKESFDYLSKPRT